MYPRVIVNEKKLFENVKSISDRAKLHGIDTIAVTKVFCAIEELAQICVKAGVSGLADSRVENLKNLQAIPVEKTLLRLPMLSEVEDVVKYADVSLNSEIDTLKALNKYASVIGRQHKIILMVDLGDLREGVLPEQVNDVVDAMAHMHSIKLEGIGVNLTCYGGVIPTPENLGQLVQIAREIETKYGVELKVVSGGNSSSLYLMDQDEMPSGINQLRIGEAFVLGRETAYGESIPGTHDDAFLLEAQIVELKEKNSIPTGKIGMDAFGNKPTFEDKGKMLRAIVGIGRQDVEPSGLMPMDKNIEIIGASSDHMILDMTKSESTYKVGDVIKFKMDYGAMLRLFTSVYVDKVLES